MAAYVSELEPPPGEGVYLTDGKLLAQMVGTDAQGRFVLEDCAANCDAPAGERPPWIILGPAEFMERWMTVEAFARRRRKAAHAA